jgi:hypothetical protein
MSGRQRRGRGRGGLHQYGSHDASSSRGDKSSGIFEFPILKFGVGSNFVVFKKKDPSICRKRVHAVGQTDEYFVPPAIVAGVQFAGEDLDPVNFPFGFLRK